MRSPTKEEDSDPRPGHKGARPSASDKETQQKIDEAFEADDDWERREDGGWRLTPEAFEQRTKEALASQQRELTPVEEVWRLIESFGFRVAELNNLLRDPELHKAEVIIAATVETKARDAMYRRVRNLRERTYSARGQAELLADVVERGLERGDEPQHIARLIVGAVANLGLLPTLDLPDLEYDGAVDRVALSVEERLVTFYHPDHRVVAMFVVIDALKALGASDAAAHRVFKESHRHKL